MTGARDQSLESSQGDWPTKVLASSEQTWRNVRRKAKLSVEKLDKYRCKRPQAGQKKLELCTDMKRKEIFVQICREASDWHAVAFWGQKFLLE